MPRTKVGETLDKRAVRVRPDFVASGLAPTVLKPILFKFGVDICYGKGTKPIVFEGNLQSRMATGGYFGKKLK